MYHSTSLFGIWLLYYTVTVTFSLACALREVSLGGEKMGKLSGKAVVPPNAIQRVPGG